MPSRMARKTMMFLKNTDGSYQRQPRLINHSRTPVEYIYGKVDVNTNATTPFSRGKVHQGVISGLHADLTPVRIDDGDLIQDRYDNYYYFVMSRKGKFYNEETVYYDATMYRCDTTLDVYRFTQGTRDTFGRPVQASPTKITATPVRAMTNPMNYDVLQQKDRVVAQNKIEICVQTAVGVTVGDRMVTANGNKFIVQTIDNTSLTGLVLCGVDTDVR